MNTQFNQPKQIVNVEVNKQSIARNFGIKDDEVCYAITGQDLTGYKAIFNKDTQHAFELPAGLTGIISSLSEVGILTYTDGTVDLGAYAVVRANINVVGSFTTGATVNTRNDALMYGDIGYRWAGTLPKTVSAGDTPLTTGGVSSTAWVIAYLRDDLAAPGLPDLVDSSRVKTQQDLLASAIRSQLSKNSDIVTVEDFYLPTDTDDTLAFQRAIDSGAYYITSSALSNKQYTISASLVINRKLILDLNQCGITQTTDAPHFVISTSAAQTYGVELRDIVMGNAVATTRYQVEAVNVGGLRLTRLYCYGNNLAFGFAQIANDMESYIFACKSTNTTGRDINLFGLGADGLRTVDTTIYDCRLERGKDGIVVGNYCEGVFIRRNILYSHSAKQIVFNADSGKGLVSGKIQENDIDSGANGGIYIKNFTNMQICDNWFADTTSPTQIELDTGADDTVITGNQAYPNQAWLVDGGVGTTVTGNMVRGGSVPIYFKATANKTTIVANSILYSTSASISVNGHMGDLFIDSNNLSNGISGTTATGMKFYNNKGDATRGTTTKAALGNTSPRTITVGPRPESLAITGGSVTSIIVNNVTLYPANGSYTGYLSLGLLPPGSTVQIDFSTSNQPWLTRVIS